MNSGKNKQKKSRQATLLDYVQVPSLSSIKGELTPSIAISNCKNDDIVDENCLTKINLVGDHVNNAFDILLSSKKRKMHTTKYLFDLKSNQIMQVHPVFSVAEENEILKRGNDSENNSSYQLNDPINTKWTCEINLRNFDFKFLSKITTSNDKNSYNLSPNTPLVVTTNIPCSTSTPSLNNNVYNHDISLLKSILQKAIRRRKVNASEK
eukprot:gene11311-15172_t